MNAAAVINKEKSLCLFCSWQCLVDSTVWTSHSPACSYLRSSPNLRHLDWIHVHKTDIKDSLCRAKGGKWIDNYIWKTCLILTHENVKGTREQNWAFLPRSVAVNFGIPWLKPVLHTNHLYRTGRCLLWGIATLEPFQRTARQSMPSQRLFPYLISGKTKVNASVILKLQEKQVLIRRPYLQLWHSLKMYTSWKQSSGKVKVHGRQKAIPVQSKSYLLGSACADLMCSQHLPTEVVLRLCP